MGESQITDTHAHTSHAIPSLQFLTRSGAKRRDAQKKKIERREQQRPP